jgi:hypothetical protein
MAVDIMVMPLARYISGNYITPFMEQIWALQGVYKIVRPAVADEDAIEEIPPGVPYGGLAAEARCEAIAAELVQQLKQQPELAGALWDEAAEPVFFDRVDHGTLWDLRWRAATLVDEKPSLLRRIAWRLLGRRAASSAVAFAAANVFVPGAFDEPFELEAPSDLGVYDCGSLPRLMDELAQLAVSVEAGTAEGEVLSRLVTAAEIARERRLPLILDL